MVAVENSIVAGEGTALMLVQHVRSQVKTLNPKPYALHLKVSCLLVGRKGPEAPRLLLQPTCNLVCHLCRGSMLLVGRLNWVAVDAKEFTFMILKPSYYTLFSHMMIALCKLLASNPVHLHSFAPFTVGPQKTWHTTMLCLVGFKP